MQNFNLQTQLFNNLLQSLNSFLILLQFLVISHHPEEQRGESLREKEQGGERLRENEDKGRGEWVHQSTAAGLAANKLSLRKVLVADLTTDREIVGILDEPAVGTLLLMPVGLGARVDRRRSSGVVVGRRDILRRGGKPVVLWVLVDVTEDVAERWMGTTTRYRRREDDEELG